MSAQQHATLARTGGSGRFSDAVYAMSVWLDGQKIGEPIALDWGIKANIEVVTAGRVRPLEIHYFTGDAVEPFKRQARALLAGATRVYLVLWAGGVPATLTGLPAASILKSSGVAHISTESRET